MAADYVIDLAAQPFLFILRQRETVEVEALGYWTHVR